MSDFRTVVHGVCRYEPRKEPWGCTIDPVCGNEYHDKDEDRRTIMREEMKQ